MDQIMKNILFFFAFLSFFPVMVRAEDKGDTVTPSNADNLVKTRKSKWHGVLISVVLNESKKNIELAGQYKKEIVHPGKSSLKCHLRIPFASMKEYLKEIIADIAYVPKNALRVKTRAGTFGLWEDERGIQYCLAEKKPLEENSVQKLLGKDKLTHALSLTLLIGEKGLLDLVSSER